MAKTTGSKKRSKKPLTEQERAEKKKAEDCRQEGLAASVLGPTLRHTAVAAAFGNALFDTEGRTDQSHDIAAMLKLNKAAAAGEKKPISDILMSQATTLDTLMTELLRRATLHLGKHPDAVDRYLRLGLRAQSNCRSTLETLAKLHQPREQIVKHVHVNEGGQAVVADQFNQHTGVNKNAQSDEQPHATRNTSQSPALPCQDATGHSMPSASRKGQETVQDARRD